ncbi:tyrosine-type recombinase/integrase [Erwinia mallotivora]|uniref:tyrosine-type recombinase/integrase n=1 Tax=Erwinia mallotivora TaxID=69222 RepID=UPI0021C251FA|nr:site-specific integrase [Erwinia mallotivora]
MNGDNADGCWQLLMEKYFLHKQLKEQTELSYVKVVDNFRKYAGLICGPQDITRCDVLAWRHHELEEQGASLQTWNNKVAYLRALYNFWIRQQLIDSEDNPFNSTAVKSPEKIRETLSDTQMTRVALVMQQFEDAEKRAAGDLPNCALYPVWYWRIVLDTLRFTGMRQNQLLHIRLKDVRINEGAIELSIQGSKTCRERTFPIVSHLRPQLKVLIDRAQASGATLSDRLFHYERFVTMPCDREKLAAIPSLQPLRSFFRRLSNECGFFVTPHRLGHTLLKSPERNLHLVKELPNHSSTSNTTANREITARTLAQDLSLYADKPAKRANGG